ncbi:TPA: AbiH family protein [Listeria monocytogenes]
MDGMNITFLIGNGFDIQMGLKTSYTDFYDNVVASKLTENQIYNSIKDKPTEWKAVWGKTFFSARNVDLSMFLVLLFFKKAN